MHAGQGKYVASLDVDHSGSRVLSGSRDYSVRLFDFNGMKSDLKSFRQIQPFDGHPVHAVSWSPTGMSWHAMTVYIGIPELETHAVHGPALSPLY